MTTKWRVIGLLFLLQLVNYVDRANISVAGPSILRDLHLNAADFGWVLAAFSLGYTLCQIPGGLLADRFGPRVMLVIAPIVWSVFVGATGLATSLLTLVAARLLFGMAEGSANASLYKVVGEHFPKEERGLANSLWVTAYALGPALAAPAVASLDAAAGWRGVFFACALPGVAVAVMLGIFLPSGSNAPAPPPAKPRAETRAETRADTRAETGAGGLGGVLKQKAPWLLFAAAFLFNQSYYGMLGWIPTYLNTARGLDLKAMGWAASIPYLGATVGLIVLGIADRRLFHRHRAGMIAACLVASALGLWTAFNAETAVQSIAGLSVAAFFLYGALGSFGAIVIALAPARARGSFAGFISTGTQASGIVAPIVIGFMVRETGSFAGGFAFMIATLLVSACCFLVLDRMIGGQGAEGAVPAPQAARS